MLLLRGNPLRRRERSPTLWAALLHVRNTLSVHLSTRLFQTLSDLGLYVIIESWSDIHASAIVTSSASASFRIWYAITAHSSCIAAIL